MATTSKSQATSGWAEWANVTYGRVGKQNEGGQTKFFGRFAPNFIKQMFAHPGLKPGWRKRHSGIHIVTCTGGDILTEGDMGVKTFS